MTRGLGPSSRRVLIDMAGPAIFALFYLATGELIEATWVLVAASAAASVVNVALDRRLAPLPLAIGCASALSAVLSSALADSSFIKIEATLSHLAVATVLLGGGLCHFNPLRVVFGAYLRLPNDVWHRLAVRFGLLALGLALANEIVRRTQSDAVWVAYKVVGIRILHLLFLASQLPMIVKAIGKADPDARPAGEKQDAGLLRPPAP